MIVNFINSKSHNLQKALRVLDKKDQRKILIIACIQTLLSILDLVGVVCIGILGSLTLSTSYQPETNNKLLTILSSFGAGSLEKSTQVSLLLVISVTCLISRSLISIFITRRTLYFLSSRSAFLSAKLLDRLLLAPPKNLNLTSTQELVYAVNFGMEVVLLRILGVSVSLLSDFSLLILLGFGLLYIDPYFAILSFLVFAIFILAMSKVTNKRGIKLGESIAELNIQSNEMVFQSLSSYREVLVSNKRNYFTNRLLVARRSLSDYMAELTYLPYMSKYYIEIMLVVGSLLVGLFQFIRFDISQAVGSLTIFFAATSRLAPALLRLQQGNFVISSNAAIAEPTFRLLEGVDVKSKLEHPHTKVEEYKTEFLPQVLLENVNFKYTEYDEFSLSNISLQIGSGNSIGIVGNSGAGKSTLLDVLLGVNEVDSGKVLISGLTPRETFKKWPGSCAYVPQEVYFINGTIRENIAFGVTNTEIDDGALQRAIETANLVEYVNSLPLGLETLVGENGELMSGGQKQRLGIARALYSSPQLLIMDEATSSLDGLSESLISEALSRLKGKMTTIIVAHRLSTIRYADEIIYLDKGHVVARGTFEEIKAAIPEFKHQAELMGL